MSEAEEFLSEDLLFGDQVFQSDISASNKSEDFSGENQVFLKPQMTPR